MEESENVWFVQKISIPTPRKVIVNSEGRGVSKAKNFKGKYEAKLEFLEGWGCSDQINLLWQGYGYFLDQHNENVVLTQTT